MSLAPSMRPSPGYADTAEELRPNGAAIRKADIKTTVFVGNIETTSCSRLNARQAEPLPGTPSFMQIACQLINSLSQDTETSPYLSLIIGCYKINKNGFFPKILVGSHKKLLSACVTKILSWMGVVCWILFEQCIRIALNQLAILWTMPGRGVPAESALSECSG